MDQRILQKKARQRGEVINPYWLLKKCLKIHYTLILLLFLLLSPLLFEVGQSAYRDNATNVDDLDYANHLVHTEAE